MYVSGTFVGAVAAVMRQLAVRTPKRSDRPEMWGSEGEVELCGTHWDPLGPIGTQIL